MNEREIFIAALELESSASRQHYLDQVCQDDAALRRRVENLLEVHDRAGGFLNKPVVAPMGTGDYTPVGGEGHASAGSSEQSETSVGQGENAGTVIGPFKLLQPIGEGGMGSVWMAQQQEPVKRLVALKLIKPGMDSGQVLARFEAERQALALMDHPNIARVLDAGTTEAARPYFVMELVKGVPLTTYCDEQRLTPKQRLELFVPVCQAIQHAHQKGIIHRDIKPSNVLVALYDGKPVPKVIDFGIAKATGQQLTEKTLVTGLGTVVGTLEYMSPEQAELNQLDIDTRSDIYSLGVLLYELLTGSTPLEKKRLKQAALLEVLRLIREEEPPRPSTRLSESKDALPSISAQRQMEPVKLARLVRGELDWLVMKALEKDRNRRYETASAFAADVQRYLHDEPVLACPPSASYRLRKFVRRYKGRVLAAALIFLAVVGGVIGTTIGMVRAEHARGVQEHLRQVAETKEREAIDAAVEEKKAKETAQKREAETRALLNFFLYRVIGAARPEGRPGGLGHEVTLRKALEAALHFVDESFADQPMIEARLRMTLGVSFTYLGDAKIAADQYQAARSLYTKHLGREHPSTVASTEGLATQLSELGRHEDALKLCKETLAIRKAQLGPDHPDTLLSMTNLATCYVRLERHTEALNLREELLPRLKSKVGPDDPLTLVAMHNLANSYSKVGRYRDALQLYEETLAIRKIKVGRDNPDTLLTMHNLAGCYESLGRKVEGLKLHEETLALQITKLGRGHTDTLLSMYNVARVYADLGRYADAAKLFEETVTRRVEKLGRDHRDSLWSMFKLAVCYYELGRYEDALKLHEETLARRKATLGPDHTETLASMHELAISYTAFGRTLDALKLFEKVLPLEKKRLGRDHPDTLVTTDCLANVYADLGRNNEAFKLREESLTLRKAKQSADDPLTLVSMHNLALSYRDLGQHPAAIKLHEETLALRKIKLGADHPDTLRSMFNLANCYADVGRHPDALKLRQETLALRKVKIGPNHPATLLTMLLTAESLVKLDRGPEALPIIDECIRRANGRVVHPRLLATVTALRAHHFAKMKDAAGCRETAEKWEQLKRADALSLYDTACLRAVLAAVIRQDPNTPRADADRLARAEADRAMVWLTRAINAGYRDAAWMAKDTDLDALRDREDFNKLLTELKAKTRP
jgi:serine/threonine protein kinase/tetratricopeptide (TPR) repeat protein